MPPILATLRAKKPLVHHITNWVTIYDCANATRAIGALPVMAHAPEEVEQMSGISSALVLNIGTLTPALVDAMLLAGKSANAKKIPIVLDAVGAGATDLRTKKALELIEKLEIGIIKGNAGEIAILAGASAEVKGVESMGVEGDIKEIAQKLSETTGAVVVATGAEDFVVDAKANLTYTIRNGHERMGSVVGTGCVSASIIGSFAAVEPNLAHAAAAALCCFGIAGELASLNEHARGPGTYLHTLIDELSLLDAAKIKEMQKVE
ncbi:hydroxyethylthiazole kinase [Candidatus Micrarchaeota archaeon]|nr:hydroxyethylthiazole kinase [Candidatus Micrarchaeota archaeon]MBU1939288.1 hydroxyethylthiazole kinase [Candidatus Micrarchaeota archaeon]